MQKHAVVLDAREQVTRDNKGALKFLNRGENLGMGGTVSGGFRFTNPGLLLSTLILVYENDLKHGKQIGSTFYEAMKIYEVGNGENFDFVEDVVVVSTFSVSAIKPVS